MPARKVNPYRPTVGEIRKLLRTGADAYWVDAEGRTYGFMSTDFSRALWDRGAMSEDEAHMWVLLPPAKFGQKVGEYVTFPPVDARVNLSPYVRPKEAARLSVQVVKYLYRPRRQRAAGIVASVDEFVDVGAPTGSRLDELDAMKDD